MRTRGLIGYVMTDPQVTGPTDSYAVFVRSDGAIRMVHSEGVAYLVTDEKPWRWNDYNEGCPSYAPADLLALTATAEQVDLADWIHTFGARLESNFHQIEAWMLENAGATK
jgi:hypothetical protein